MTFTACIRTCCLFLLFASHLVYAQTEEQKITLTLNDYIQGSSYNRLEQIKQAFYENAILLLEDKDKTTPVREVKISDYLAMFKGKSGDFNGRVGEIVAINRDGNIATAKVHITLPKQNLRFVDLFVLRKIGDHWKIMSKTATSAPSNHKTKRILFIVSSAHFHGKSSIPAGVSFSEIVWAYSQFQQAGYSVDFVSPEGGALPLQYIDFTDSLQKSHLYNRDFMHALANTKSPQEIDPKQYVAVQYIGGSNALYGVAENRAIQDLVMEIYENQNGIVSAVCHGTAGLVNLKTKDGKYLVAGRRITGFPEAYENKSIASFKHHPFLIQETIEQRGGIFKNAARGQVHVEVDGRIVTGQDNLSSTLAAQKIIEMLAQKN